MGSVCLLPRAPPCHLKRPLCEPPVREGNERDQPAGRHQCARGNAAVEEQAGRDRAGGQREHEPPDLGGGDAPADGVRDHALQQRRAAGPEDATAPVRDGQRHGRVSDRGAERERDIADSQQGERSRDAAAQAPLVGAGEAEGGEGSREAAHPAGGPQHRDARAVAPGEHLLAEIGQQHQHAAESEPEARLDREESADAPVGSDVAHPFAQIAQPEQVLDLRAGLARLFHHLDRLHVGAVREHAGGRAGEEHGNEPGEERERDRLALAGQLEEQGEQRDDVEPVACLRHGVRRVQCAEIAVVPQDPEETPNCKGGGQGVAFILDAMDFDVRPRQAAHWAALALLCVLCVGALFWLTLPQAEPLRRSNPATTAIIETRMSEARERGRAAKRNQHWVPLNRISIWLIRAVVNSEDARFFEHDGIDGTQTRIALTTALEDGHFRRGASTITQQLAKNLWLGEERTLWRKLREAILARRLEALGKRRVLELYLNVAEWGDGIYGADAAARYWFQKSAADLQPEEAAVLAAMLPAPRKRNPVRPSPGLRKRAREILRLYSMYGELSPDELGEARWRLQEILAG